MLAFVGGADRPRKTMVCPTLSPPKLSTTPGVRDLDTAFVPSINRETEEGAGIARTKGVFAFLLAFIGFDAVEAAGQAGDDQAQRLGTALRILDFAMVAFRFQAVEFQAVGGDFIALE